MIIDNTKYRIKPEWSNVVLLWCALDESLGDVTPSPEERTQRFVQVFIFEKMKTYAMNEIGQLDWVLNALNEDHFGDCVKVPTPCSRCLVESALEDIAYIFGIESTDMLETIV